MKHRTSEKRFFLLTYIFALGLPTTSFAGGGHTHSNSDGVESNIEIEFFSMGDSKSKTGNAQVGTSGVLLETEYENDDMSFSFNYERWSYNWTNPENLSFVSGTAGNNPWSTFSTLQFGWSYEQDISEQWEFKYYVEAESSFEKQTSESREYEAGVDFTYDLSDSWAFTLNTNFEYLDAEGGALGVDLGIEWNHDKQEGWSGEFEVSSEFPETSLTYHFIKEFSTTMFYNESGTNTIRLSDSSPVTGMQGGYLEDEYNSLGIQLDYDLTNEGSLSFSVQQNTGRELSFTDRAGKAGAIYELDDVTEISLTYSHIF